MPYKQKQPLLIFWPKIQEGPNLTMCRKGCIQRGAAADEASGGHGVAAMVATISSTSLQPMYLKLQLNYISVTCLKRTSIIDIPSRVEGLHRPFVNRKKG